MMDLSGKLKKIRAFVFDMDGVLSVETSQLDESGDPVRTANVKDGFAIRTAILQGFYVAVITGGCQERAKLRCKNLGITHYYENVSNKQECLEDFLLQTSLCPENILYMGDDLIDFQAMKLTGIAACPIDAVREIRDISLYISNYEGGRGCVRDVIELVMKAQNRWEILNISNQKSA